MAVPDSAARSNGSVVGHPGSLQGLVQGQVIKTCRGSYLSVERPFPLRPQNKTLCGGPYVFITDAHRLFSVIRNQQVAGSIPAGGSIYLVLNQSITDNLQIGTAEEVPGVGTQAGTQTLDAREPAMRCLRTPIGQFRITRFERVSGSQ